MSWVFLLPHAPAGVGAARGREKKRWAMSVGIKCVYALGPLVLKAEFSSWVSFCRLFRFPQGLNLECRKH